MVEVEVTRRYKGNKYGQEKSYTYSVNAGASNGGGVNIPTPDIPKPYPEPLALQFNNTSTPGIPDWSIYQLVYGRYPKFVLLINDEDDNELEHQQVPIRTIVDELLVSFIWDLPELASGVIIISK